MRNFLYTISLFAFLGCDGSTGNPATEDRSDLNPPKQLISITGDASLTLSWQSFNAEDDFQGFMVFGANKALDDGTEDALYKKIT